MAYGNKKYYTSVVPYKIQAIWNESFIFPYDKNCVVTCSVYDSVSFGRDTVIGDAQIDAPERDKPSAKWCPIHARARTALDFGRTVLNSKSYDSLGQLFVAILLLDPLQLTAIGQRFQNSNILLTF